MLTRVPSGGRFLCQPRFNIRALSPVKMATNLVRKSAPRFVADAVVGDDFEKVTIESLTSGGKYLVLFFYPLDFTFVCPTEIIAFSDAIDRFQATSCNVAAVSVDSKHTHLAFIQTPRNKGGLGKMNIPVISDITKAISKAYGMLVEDAADDMAGVSLRGTVIIDGKGTVRHVSCNDAPVGRDVDEYLRLVQAFQYTDKHGEVCPAGWRPGQKSMKADPKGSKEYFEAANK